jgi:hypothetical protein
VLSISYSLRRRLGNRFGEKKDKWVSGLASNQSLEPTAGRRNEKLKDEL